MTTETEHWEPWEWDAHLGAFVRLLEPGQDVQLLNAEYLNTLEACAEYLQSCLDDMGDPYDQPQDRDKAEVALARLRELRSR